MKLSLLGKTMIIGLLFVGLGVGFRASVTAPVCYGIMGWAHCHTTGQWR